MKKFMPVFLFLLVFAASAEARVRWGPRVGFMDGEPMVGFDVLLNMGAGFFFNPNVEVSSDNVSTQADVHYAMELTRDAALWFGAGIAAISPERDLDVGVNVLAGIGKNTGGKIFYAQVKHTVPTGGDGYNTIAVGIRF